MPRNTISFSCLMVLFSFKTFVGTERPPFRKDYVYEKAFHSFYKVHKTPASWAAALVRCEAEGAKLVVPHSLDEADSIPVLIAHLMDKFRGVYIGCHDLYSKGSFVTTNGSSIKGTILDILWESDRPDSVGRCVGMQRSGRLFKLPCHQTLPYVCKVHASNITYNKDCDSYNPGWKPGPNGHCYLVHEEPRDWKTAYGSCHAAGGYLAILNDRPEADYVRELFKRVGDKRIPDTDFAFLGFSDLFRRHHYRTVLGQPLNSLNFTDWDTKCKSDEQDDTNSRCGGVHRSGLLTSESCERPAVFFCEKTVNGANTANSSHQQPMPQEPPP